MKRSDKNKDEWIDKTMNSLEGIQRTEPPPYLLNKIEQRLCDKVVSIGAGIVSWRVVSAAAALIILLVSANLFILTGQSRTNQTKTGMEKIVYYYGLSDNNILDNL